MIIEDQTYEKNGFVTRENARFRASIVSDCSYDVTLALPKGETYYGHVVIKFKLSEVPTKSLYIDFRGVKIGALTVNGKEATDPNAFVDHHIHLPLEHLAEGDNIISLNIWNKFRKDGVGLHSYTDSADQE